MVDPAIIDYMTRNEADMAFRRRVHTVFEWIDPQDDHLILDMPCGRGFYLNMIRYASNCQLVGADLDWEILCKAQQNTMHLKDVMLYHASIYDLPFADNTFDAVILSEVLEHLDDDVLGLREAYRVLKPGGVAVITVPNADYPFLWDPVNRVLEDWFGTHIQYGPLAGIWANHVRLYSREELRKTVQSAHFDIEAERAFTHYSFPFIHNLVYGIGKPLLEQGLLPDCMAQTADRIQFDKLDTVGWMNPVAAGLRIFELIDNFNRMDETPELSTVNLCIKGRKPNE